MKHCKVWVYMGLELAVCGAWFEDGKCPTHGRVDLAPAEQARRAAEQIRRAGGD